jgi:hypothetical protein
MAENDKKDPRFSVQKMTSKISEEKDSDQNVFLKNI